MHIANIILYIHFAYISEYHCTLLNIKSAVVEQLGTGIFNNADRHFLIIRVDRKCIIYLP